MSTLTFHRFAIAPLIGGLKNTHAFITKAHSQITAQSADPTTYLSARLYPDMGDFRFQIYRLTDAARGIPPRVNPSIEAFDLPEEEQSFEELLQRIEKTITYLEGVTEEQFRGKEGEEVVLLLRGGTLEIKFPAAQYVAQFAHPNFWFHTTTAYDILRSKGVEVGKFDFLNGAKLIEPKVVEKKE